MEVQLYSKIFLKQMANCEAHVSFQLKVHTMDLIGILEHLFDKLKVDPAKHKVQTALESLCICRSQPGAGACCQVLVAMVHFQVERETGSGFSRIALWDRFGNVSFIRQSRNEKETGPN